MFVKKIMLDYLHKVGDKIRDSCCTKRQKEMGVREPEDVYQQQHNGDNCETSEDEPGHFLSLKIAEQGVTFAPFHGALDCAHGCPNPSI